MVIDDGWKQIYPKPERPSPQPTEIEMFGGPLDGQRRVVVDPDEPIVIEIPAYKVDGEPGHVVGTFKLIYRRRVVGSDEPERVPLWFDFMPLELV